MTDKINGRTPEEIKNGLELCCVGKCSECPYRKECDEHLACGGDMLPADVVLNDIAALVQQIERERDAAVERCVNADDVSAGYYHEIQQLESAQPKWISVADELPKKWRENDAEQTLVNYQIYSPKYGVDIGNYLKPAGIWVIMGLPVDDVTHWMPLPSVPKEEA